MHLNFWKNCEKNVLKKKYYYNYYFCFENHETKLVPETKSRNSGITNSEILK